MVNAYYTNEDLAKWREGADSFKQVTDAASYTRKLPELIGFAPGPNGERHCRYLLQVMSEERCEVIPADVLGYDNGYAADLAMIFDSRQRAVTYSQVDHVTCPTFAQIAAFSDQPVPLMDKQCGFIFKAGKDNYGHLLVEMLPRLEILLGGQFSEPLALLVPTLPLALRNLLSEVIANLYSGCFELVDMRHSLVQARNLITTSPISKHNAQKSHVLQLFVSKLLYVAEKHSSLPIKSAKKIFISRANAPKRQMVRAIELENIARAAGYYVIRPEEFSIWEQINIFSKAEIVAGFMGAGLTNVIFCPPHTKVKMFDPGLADYFFCDLASLFDLDFQWIFTQPIGEPSPDRLSAELEIDLRLFQVHLKY
jgi:capsular polysaccharide biosynthesis protein